MTRRLVQSPAHVRVIRICLAVALLGLLLVAPLAAVFIEAFSRGIAYFISAVTHPHTLSALSTTCLTALAVVPLTTAFGIAAAWAIAHHEFRGKRIFAALVELPFTVSPVVAGLALVLLYGHQGPLAPMLRAMNIRVLFAWPSIALATAFVTLPLVASELIPLMRAQGNEEELAALTLGARPWQVFFRVTLPKIRWGLLYGVVLATARALGEFGAVAIVSGLLRGATTTLPLHVEMLYDEYDFAGAFAAASLLSGMGLLTLGCKRWLEHRTRAEREVV